MGIVLFPVETIAHNEIVRYDKSQKARRSRYVRKHYQHEGDSHKIEEGGHISHHLSVGYC